ncbi:MAG: hypothetical protein NXI27_04355 [Alphaproteobacteria bacterium]|nr:hypothetical protein [Alphaproteobacteria bacterium]
MGSIIVYKGTHETDAARLEGMSEFGASIRDEFEHFATTSGTTKLTIVEAQDILKTILDDYISRKDTNNNRVYTLKFLYPGSESYVTGTRLRVAPNGVRKLRLRLSDTVNGPTNKRVWLALTVDDLESGDKRMNIAIPHKTSGGSFDYLDEIISDVKANNHDENGYMVAASLFNRCQ